MRSIWSASSLALGLTTRSGLAVLLPLIAIPIALPFGYADQWLGSDAPLVWWFAFVGGVLQVAIVLVAIAGRALYHRMHSSQA